MDRRDIILQGLDPAALTGMELGPLSKPIVSRKDGPVLYVDHADTDALKAKYAGNVFYALDDFVDVDLVWTGQPLRNLVPPGFQADYVIASHVVEHVPDLVRWLEDLRSVLGPAGEIRLAVPDKRYTFDRYRAVTRLSDVLDAWMVRRAVPGGQALMDHLMRAESVDTGEVWRGQAPSAPPLKLGAIRNAMEVGRRVVERGDYEDAHCWVFTPFSFADLLGWLCELGLVRLACRRLVDTPDFSLEFYVDLVPCDDPARAAESWRAAAAATRQHDASVAGGNGETSADHQARQHTSLARLSEDVGTLRAALLRAQPTPDAALPATPAPEVTVERLDGTLWLYFASTTADNPALLQLKPGGRIGIYDHPNESAWRFTGGVLTFLHRDGGETLRFDQLADANGKLQFNGRLLLGPSSEMTFHLREV